MNILNYVLAIIIVFAGLIAGAALAFIAQEELKPGKRYFFLMKKLLIIALAAAVGMKSAASGAYAELPLAAALIITAYKIRKHQEAIIYAIFGIILFMNADNATFFFINASLIFIYGLPSATLAAQDFLKHSKLLLARALAKTYSPFIIASLFLILLQKML